MCKDMYDKLCWVLLAIIMISVALLLIANGNSVNKNRGPGQSKSLERELAYRARVELIAKIYEPVVAFRKEHNEQMALLKLDELIRKYPGEAHGHILQGEILLSMGVLEEAVSAYVEGIKLNGDYVDAKSPLTRRAEVQKLVEEGQKKIDQRVSSDPGNRSLLIFRQKINYLKSRLAGGCE